MAKVGKTIFTRVGTGGRIALGRLQEFQRSAAFPGAGESCKRSNENGFDLFPQTSMLLSNRRHWNEGANSWPVQFLIQVATREQDRVTRRFGIQLFRRMSRQPSVVWVNEIRICIDLAGLPIRVALQDQPMNRFQFPIVANQLHR